MSDEKKITDNENQYIAGLKTFRTGEGEISGITGKDQQIIDDPDHISELFSNAKPGSDQISESVDNFVLGHIKEKSRKIRREQKIVHLFPRYKWAAAAVMGALICVVTFNLVYKKANTEIPDNHQKIIPAKLAEDVDGNGKVNIIDAYIMDRRLMSGVAMPAKLDLNKDGNVNKEDIISIIKTAVSLEGGEV